MRKDTLARELTIEVIVGTFVFMIILALAYFTIVIGHDRFFGDAYEYQIQFRDVKGLRKGDSVIVRGMPVGQIKRLELGDSRVVATIEISVELLLRDDYVISVVPTSILGGNYLLIREGSEEQTRLAVGTVLLGNSGYDLMAEASTLVAEVQHRLIDKGAIEEIMSSLVNLREIAEKINNGEGTLGLLVNDRVAYDELVALASNVHSLAATLSGGEGTIGKLIAHESLYDNMHTFMKSLVDGENTISQVLNDDGQLYKDLCGAVASLKNIAAALENGEGTLGKIISDDELYNEVAAVIKELRATIDDFRENSPIVTFTSVFFGTF